MFKVKVNLFEMYGDKANKCLKGFDTHMKRCNVKFNRMGTTTYYWGDPRDLEGALFHQHQFLGNPKGWPTEYGTLRPAIREFIANFAESV